MTTGRINQVTTFRPHTPGDVTPDIHNCSKLLSQSGVHQKVCIVNKSDCNHKGMLTAWPTGLLGNSIKGCQVKLICILFPKDLTSFRLISPCHMTRIKAFRGNCLQLAYTQSWRIPRWLNQKKALPLISKQSTIPPHNCQQPQKSLDLTNRT